jgi:hypothetical protein
MIGGGGLMMNIEKGAKVGPKGGSELWTTVGCDDGGQSEVGNPGVEESGGAIGGGGRGKWDYFWPACVAVDDGEKVSVTMGRR